MFEPECQNIECPQCFFGKIYFDSEIGYYCMYCGDQLSPEDMEILMGKNALSSFSEQKLGGGHKKPFIEIKELPPRRAKKMHISRNVIKSEESEQ